jgi:hypothetical protein
MWVNADDIEIKAPFTMTYRRQQHRRQYATKEQKSIPAEQMTVKFAQTQCHINALKLGLANAHEFCSE